MLFEHMFHFSRNKWYLRFKTPLLPARPPDEGGGLLLAGKAAGRLLECAPVRGPRVAQERREWRARYRR